MRRYEMRQRTPVSAYRQGACRPHQLRPEYHEEAQRSSISSRVTSASGSSLDLVIVPPLEFPERPKGMHYDTYMKLLWEHQEAEVKHLAGMRETLDKLKRQVG